MPELSKIEYKFKLKEIKSLNMQTEKELIEVAKAGGEKAFASLLNAHKSQIRSIAYRFFGDTEERNDAVAEINVKVYYGLHRYSPDFKFSTWCLTIAKNYCIDKVKKRKVKTVAFDFIDTTFFPESTLNKEEEIIRKEKYNQLNYLLSLLPPQYYNPVYLFFFEEKKYREIAVALDMPIGSVKGCIHRGKQIIKGFYINNN